MLLFWKVNFNTFSASLISQYIFQELLMKFIGWLQSTCLLYKEYFYYSEMNLYATICYEVECCKAWKRNDNMEHPQAIHRVQRLCGINSTSWHYGCLLLLPASEIAKGSSNIEKNYPLTFGVYLSPVSVILENYR